MWKSHFLRMIVSSNLARPSNYCPSRKQDGSNIRMPTREQPKIPGHPPTSQRSPTMRIPVVLLVTALSPALLAQDPGTMAAQQATQQAIQAAQQANQDAMRQAQQANEDAARASQQ